MLKAVLFDAYGTLLDTGTGSVDAAGAILRKNGRDDLSPSEFYAHWKRLHAQHMARVRPFVTEEALYRLDLEQLYREYSLGGDPREDVEIMLSILGKRTPYPEAKAVLEKLTPLVTVCIASVTDTAPLLHDLARGQLCPHRVFTSEGLRCYKPDPAFYAAVLGELGLAPSEALFVGDSLSNDVAGPQAAGIPGCWINRKGQMPGDIRPAYTMPDLCGLPALVNSLLGE